VLRGPDSSELETDLGKVERCLERLETDNALSPEERRLRSLYYTHLRNKVRWHLASSKAHKQTGEQVDTNSSPPQGFPVQDTGSQTSSINQVEPSDESWKVITPSGLIHAVTNIRKDFCELCDGQRRYRENQCFKDLHPLASGLTESAVFKKHFWDCVGALCKVVPLAFARLLDLSLNQNRTIGEAPVQWAALQVTDLIEREDRLVNHWIKSVCDRRSDVEPATTEEFMEKVVFWTDWRAPKWLRMMPNGNSPYDASTAWERMDEAKTTSALRALREDRWILSLESTLEKLVGSAHEVLARRRNSSRPQSGQQPSEPDSNPRGPALTDNTFLRQGKVWSISYAGRDCLIPHQRGLEYIARLLQSKGRSMNALELRLGTNPDAGVSASASVREMQTSDGHLRQERSDAKAIEQYRQKARELSVAISEAKERGDQNEVDELLQELEAIQDFVKAETGLRGRRRKFSDDAEAARSAVTNAINRAIETIRKQAPSVADHLQSNLKTGTELTYRETAAVWRVSTG
jgi:hypothetical protein